MSDFSGLKINGHVAAPATPTGTRRGSPGTWRPTRTRRRWSSPRAPATSPRRSASRPRTGSRSPAREPATAPRPCRRSTARSCSRPSACARSRSTPRSAPPGSRPASSRSSWPRRPGEHGLSSLPGSSPDVGVIGYTLGGGLSWLGRQYGFACNSVTGIDLVTADGEEKSVTAVDEPDLFWALRGGGGGYAIVTALHLALLPIADIYAGILIFPAELGAERLPRLPRLGGDRRRRRSPRSSACCGRRRSPTCRSRCAGCR